MAFIRKISAYLITALIFVATTNIVLGAHICSGELNNLSLYQETTSCSCNHIPADERNSEDNGNISFSDGNYCCSSKTLETRGVDVVYPSIGIRGVDYQAVELQLGIFDSISLSYSDVQTSVNYKHWLPHLADRDIPILVQSFLL
jgi:hypothetical protein